MQCIIHRLAIVYVIVLTLLLELPSDVAEQVPVGMVRVYTHLFAFTLLGFFVELSRKKQSFFFWIGFLFVYSFATEAMQWLLHPLCNRTFEWADLLQNVSGVLFGTVIGHYCRPFVQR